MHEHERYRLHLSHWSALDNPGYEIMLESKDINGLHLSSHWLEYRQQEKSKLLQLLRKIGEESISDNEDSSSDCDLYDDGQVSITNRKIGSKVLRIIENDFKDFNNFP